ncbi:MAG: tyrosine-type recombinase/integrase [Luteolibacter sp.]
MATTYKPKHSAYWYARFFDGSGKRVSRSTKTTSRREAKRVAAGMEASERREAKAAPDRETVMLDVRRILRAAELDFEGGTLTPTRGAELLRQLIEMANPAKLPSFRAVAAEWLDDCEKRVAFATWSSYRGAIKQAISILGETADAPVDRIDAADMARIQQGMLQAGLRGKTVGMHGSCLRRIFAHAIARGLILSNPASSLRAVSSADSRRRAPFTPQEITRLIEAASGEWRGLVIIGATTGLRCGDIRRLTSDNIQGGHIVLQPNKTARSSGTVLRIPLHPKATEWLQGRTGALFPSLAQTDGSRVSNGFKRVMKAAQVSDTVELAPGVTAVRSMHSLRHSFASMLADAGVAEDVRRKLTGHGSRLVHARYSHHADALERAVEALPEF